MVVPGYELLHFFIDLNMRGQIKNSHGYYNFKLPQLMVLNLWLHQLIAVIFLLLPSFQFQNYICIIIINSINKSVDIIHVIYIT